MIDTSFPQFLRTRDSSLAATDRSLRRRFESGELTRVRSGIYMLTSEWAALDADARYRARVAAASHRRQLGTQFSHDSAAALWRLPSLGPWPPHLHILGGRSSGVASASDVRRHDRQLDPVPAQINGITLTSLGRTAIDMSSSTTFTRAVGMMDSALAEPERGSFRDVRTVAPATKTELFGILDALMPYRGNVRVRRVIDFADGRSGSLGESLSRVQFHALGIAPPELQVPFYDEHGFIGYADFYWPELDLIGEFDGLVKYRDTTYLRGQLPGQVVIAEKEREDRLRRVVRGFTRWGWATALSPARLERHVSAHGLLRTR